MTKKPRRTPSYDKERLSDYITVTARMLRHYDEGSVGWNQTINHLLHRVDEYERIREAEIDAAMKSTRRAGGTEGR